MNNNKLGDLLEGLVAPSAEVKASQASRGSMISSDRGRVVREAVETHSATFLRSSKKCSVAAEDKGAHQGGHSNRLRDRTLL